jgi:ribosomal protein S8
MVIKQLYHFFHKLNASLKTKQSSFVVNDFHGLENVLNSMFKLFLIFGYKKIKSSNEIEVFLKYDSNGNPILRGIV